MVWVTVDNKGPYGCIEIILTLYLIMNSHPNHRKINCMPNQPHKTFGITPVVRKIKSELAFYVLLITLISACLSVHWFFLFKN